MPPQACTGTVSTSLGPLLPFALFPQVFTQSPAFFLRCPPSARAARVCKSVVSLLLTRIKLGTCIFLLDSVPWDPGSRVFCTASRRYRVTLKQHGRAEGGFPQLPGAHGGAWPEEKPPASPNKPLTLPERNEWETEKQVN